jgi:glycerophosphoryl diester phosphodiesterase
MITALILFMLQAPPHKHIVIAHRGDHVSLPENTLAAYTSAIKLGVDYIETDLRMTKDSALVIRHNSIEGMNTDSLPRFRDVLKLCRNKVKIYLDFKDADVRLTYNMILAEHMEKQIIVYANTLDQLKEWHRVAPSMPIITGVPDHDVAAFLDEYKPAAVDGNIGQYSTEILALFKRRHVAVWLDVQAGDEGPDTWSEALKEGVEGLQTDHPAILIKYLKKQDKR